MTYMNVQYIPGIMRMFDTVLTIADYGSEHIKSIVAK